MAAEVGMVPSFPIPHILPTRIATTESFGIIPVPKNIVDELEFRPSATQITDTRLIPLYKRYTSESVNSTFYLLCFSL